MLIKANHIDIFKRNIIFSEIDIQNGKVKSIKALAKNEVIGEKYILPGFIDAHVHIESSLLSPAQFARLAVVHGSVGTVSDPHEIANVLGIEGIKFMLDNANKVPFKFCFGAPPCVPATSFETAGATLTPSDIEYLFGKYPEIGYLAEVMNFPGVLDNDPDMLAKIAIAKKYNKPIDGHAPGLRGATAKKYAEAGPQTDHECFTLEEAMDKLDAGMKILIREGSAAKNYEALSSLITIHFKNLMFCSDDKHADALELSHINELVKRSLAKGYDLFSVLQMACLNPVLHYKMPIGLLRKNDPADFILIDNTIDFNILQTYLNGVLVAENGKSLIENIVSNTINKFETNFKKPSDFAVIAKSENINVIEALDGQLITKKLILPSKNENGLAIANQESDVLKIAVVNRYADVPIAVAFIKNFGIKNGAIASSVAHDSHNIVAVGTNEELICKAINLIIAEKGGLSAVDLKGMELVLPLPIAGLMSPNDGYEVSKKYTILDQFAKNELKSTLQSPFMSLSFMALLVIPSLKLSDKGLFDGESFGFTSVFV